jgi:type IV secretion system protein VirD4
LPAIPPAPVLFLLDEFAALGHLSVIERAMGLMAGYGLQLWPILQDLSQLEALYGRKAATFLANAGVLQAFNVNDLATARWLSELIGASTIAYSTGSSTVQGWRGPLPDHRRVTSPPTPRRDAPGVFER